LHKNGANRFTDARSIHPDVDLEISFLQLSIAEIVQEVVESILNSLLPFLPLLSPYRKGGGVGGKDCGSSNGSAEPPFTSASFGRSPAAF
jgi:hypothetical protein